MLIEACVSIFHMERIFYFEEKVKMVTFPCLLDVALF